MIIVLVILIYLLVGLVLSAVLARFDLFTWLPDLGDVIEFMLFYPVIIPFKLLSIPLRWLWGCISGKWLL